jgi:predicted acylesterase/phospholipase RssA
MNPSETKPFRILSLDGGGAKGVYTLGVLREVEALAKAPLCEVFHLIFGTSTGSIIAALIALGYKIDEIEKLYFTTIPAIMRRWLSRGRTQALKAEAERLFGSKDFTAFKVPIGIVCTNNDLERPMVFKLSVDQAHGVISTFKPGFGEAVVASCAAYPFFQKVSVRTQNQGQPLLLDGGYVANNPTLFALADACHALKKKPSEIAVLSVGVGNYNEPKRTIVHRAFFALWPFQHIAKMFNISSKTIEQMRLLLFPEVACVRVSETYAQAEYATDLLESDVAKLRKLHDLGRQSFAKYETDIKTVMKF